MLKDIRWYTHNCPFKNGEKVTLTAEMCPKCGQAGKRDGWHVGIYDRMGMYHKLTGVPANGIHRRFLPPMYDTCENCKGFGLVDGSFDDDDHDCPVCNGLGGILTLGEAEMKKIQRWAVARHERELHEDKSKWEKKPVPGNFILTRNTNAFIEGMLAMVKDGRKNDKRNKRIGELMLRAEQAGWVVLMEMIEKWEMLGGGLSVQKEQICLWLPGRHRIRLANLLPGAGSGNGIIQLRWKGLEGHVPAWEKIFPYQNEITLAAPGRVEGNYWQVDIPDGMGLEAAWAYLVAMRELGGL